MEHGRGQSWQPCPHSVCLPWARCLPGPLPLIRLPPPENITTPWPPSWNKVQPRRELSFYLPVSFFLSFRFPIYLNVAFLFALFHLCGGCFRSAQLVVGALAGFAGGMRVRLPRTIPVGAEAHCPLIYFHTFPSWDDLVPCKAVGACDIKRTTMFLICKTVLQGVSIKVFFFSHFPFQKQLGK